MAKPYSDDFRKCVIDNHNSGMEKSTLLAIFGMRLNTLNRWIIEHKKTGRISPKKRTQFRKRKLSDSDLSHYVKENPSATLQQMAEHFLVRNQSIWARLKQLGITLKKKRSCIRKEMKNKEENSWKI